MISIMITITTISMYNNNLINKLKVHYSFLAKKDHKEIIIVTVIVVIIIIIIIIAIKNKLFIHLFNKDFAFYSKYLKDLVVHSIINERIAIVINIIIIILSF